MALTQTYMQLTDTRSGNTVAGFYDVDSFRRFAETHTNPETSIIWMWPSKESATPLTTLEQLSAIRDGGIDKISLLANILKVSRPTIYSWESGEVTIQLVNARKIDRLYGFVSQFTEDHKKYLSNLVNANLSPGITVLEGLSQMSSGQVDSEVMFEQISRLIQQWREKAEGLAAADSGRRVVTSSIGLKRPIG